MIIIITEGECKSVISCVPTNHLLPQYGGRPFDVLCIVISLKKISTYQSTTLTNPPTHLIKNTNVEGEITVRVELGR